MPRAPKACVAAGCGAPATFHGRCDAHRHTERYTQAWAGSTNPRASLPARAAARRYTFTRDGGTCHVCGQVATLADGQLDHVLPLAQGGADAPDNWAWICKPCHAVKSAHEGVAGRRAARQRRALGGGV